MIKIGSGTLELHWIMWLTERKKERKKKKEFKRNRTQASRLCKKHVEYKSLLVHQQAKKELDLETDLDTVEC